MGLLDEATTATLYLLYAISPELAASKTNRRLAASAARPATDCTSARTRGNRHHGSHMELSLPYQMVTDIGTKKNKDLGVNYLIDDNTKYLVHGFLIRILVQEFPQEIFSIVNRAGRYSLGVSIEMMSWKSSV